MLSTTLLVLVLAAPERPIVPATLDVTQPTCLAVAGSDADALYLVPLTVCDSRACKVRLELQAVRAEGAPPEPELLAEGAQTSGADLWNGAVRGKVEAAVSRFSLPCRTTSADGPLYAGKRRYTLADRSGSWWATSDNGREQPLSRLGAGKIVAPVAIDGHPDWTPWAFARATDAEGNLMLQRIPLARLAAPPFAELIAAPRAATENLMCLGWDRDTPAMLVRSRRKSCSSGGMCREEVWLVRVTSKGAEDLTRIDTAPDSARSYLSDLDVGCTDGDLDEPTYGGVTVMVGPSLSETSIDLSVFEPREKHWNVGPLRTLRTRDGQQREGVGAVLWHPEVPYLVLRITTPSGEGERFVWADLAAKGIASR